MKYGDNVETNVCMTLQNEQINLNDAVNECTISCSERVTTDLSLELLSSSCLSLWVRRLTSSSFSLFISSSLFRFSSLSFFRACWTTVFFNALPLFVIVVVISLLVVVLLFSSELRGRVSVFVSRATEVTRSSSGDRPEQAGVTSFRASLRSDSSLLQMSMSPVSVFSDPSSSLSDSSDSSPFR